MDAVRDVALRAVPAAALSAALDAALGAVLGAAACLAGHRRLSLAAAASIATMTACCSGWCDVQSFPSAKKVPAAGVSKLCDSFRGEVQCSSANAA